MKKGKATRRSRSRPSEEPHSLKHSHIQFDAQRIAPNEFEIKLADGCAQFLLQFATGFEVLNRFSKVFNRFGLLFGQIAKELEQVVYEETIALAQRYVFPEGEGVSNAALTWMDFMDQIKQVATLYKKAAGDSDELANRIKTSSNQKKNLEQIQGSLQAIISYIKRLNTEYSKPREAANNDLINIDKLRRQSNTNPKKHNSAVHKALTKAISDAENFKTISNACNNSFEKKVLPDLVRIFGIMQSSQSQLVSSLNQSMIDFSTIAGKPAALQSSVSSTLTASISRRIESSSQGSLSKLFSMLDLTTGLFTYDLDVSIEELEKQQTELKLDAVEMKSGAGMESEENQKGILTPKIFSGTVEEVMQIEQMWWGVEEDIPICFSWLLDNVVALGGCETHQIFRIAPRVDVIAKIKENMNYGEYDLLNDQQPIVAAELLKHWLRGLREPLFPTQSYNTYIKVGRKFLDSQNIVTQEISEDCLTIYNLLPEVNLRMLFRIAGFFKIATDSYHSKLTNMSMQTLSIVFAPSCLRSPSDDILEFAQNVHAQNAFLHCFLQWCIDSELEFDYSVYVDTPPSYDEPEQKGKSTK